MDHITHGKVSTIALYWEALRETAEEEFINKTLLLEAFRAYRAFKTEGPAQKDSKEFKELQEQLNICTQHYGKGEVLMLINEVDKHWEAIKSMRPN